MAESWTQKELNACVKTYLWLRESEEAGYNPHKKNVRSALRAGPLKDRSDGSVEYRMQNISSVLNSRGESWVNGYKPADNVGANTINEINEMIDKYYSNRKSKKVHWLTDGIPSEVIIRSVKQLSEGADFDASGSIKYDVVYEGEPFPVKQVIGYAALLHYQAPLLSHSISTGANSVCFNKLDEAGLEIRGGADVVSGESAQESYDVEGLPELEEESDIYNDELETESQRFRQQVEKEKQESSLTVPQGSTSPDVRNQVTTVYHRDLRVVAYVENRAQGICELCGEEAPFRRDGGTPFLEVHHIIPLSESQNDTVQNAVAICPNCHRECHYGQDREYLRDRLLDYIDQNK